MIDEDETNVLDFLLPKFGPKGRLRLELEMNGPLQGAPLLDGMMGRSLMSRAAP